MTCPSIESCPFFNDKMADMPAVTDNIKREYCNGDYTKCARYIVAQALGKENVPADLFPMNADRANELVAK